MHFITEMHAVKILDSRARWTVEVAINGKSGCAPAGASKGTHEVHDVPAEIACAFINGKLRKAFIGEVADQKKIDAQLKLLTPKIGSNGAIAASFALYNLLWRKYDAIGPGCSFPYPLGNAFGGGAHGGSIDIQEVLLCPASAKSFPDSVKKMTDAYHELKEELKQKGLAPGMNDEGALVAKIDFYEMMDMLSHIASHNGCRIGLDVAASELYHREKYIYRNMKTVLTRDEQIDFVNRLIKKYRLFYVEDPMHEEDFDGFSEILKKNKKTLVCGDDLTTTNTQRIEKARGKISAMIVKPNQIGTVSQAIDATKMCREARITPVISHRSAETADVTISRMAVENKIPIIKCGIADIRAAKINELLRLWDAAERPKMAKIDIFR